MGRGGQGLGDQAEGGDLALRRLDHAQGLSPLPPKLKEWLASQLHRLPTHDWLHNAATCITVHFKTQPFDSVISVCV